MATTANITLSGVQNLDGVTAVAGDRVLVKDQSTASENGIYVQASGAWSRAVDADQNDEVRAGLLVYVSEGTAAGNKFYMLTTDDPIVVGSTSLAFSSLSGGGGGTPGGSVTEIQYNNTTFGGVTGFTYNSTSKKLAFAPTSPTDHVLDVSATLASGKSLLNLAATLSGAAALQLGIVETITAVAGNGANAVVGHVVTLGGAGFDGTSGSYALSVGNTLAAVSTALYSGGELTAGVQGFASGGGAGHKAGVYGSSTGGTGHGIGSAGFSSQDRAGINVGGLGYAQNATSTRVGLWAQLSTSGQTPSYTSTALGASNGNTTSPILTLLDNTTQIFLADDGGVFTFSPGGSQIAKIDSSGLSLASGAATANNVIDIVKTQNSNLLVQMQNLSSGSAAFAAYHAANDAGRGVFVGAYSTGAVTSGLQEAGAAVVFANTISQSLNIFTTNAASAIKMGPNSTESFRLGIATEDRVSITGGTLASGKVALAMTATTTGAASYGTNLVTTLDPAHTGSQFGHLFQTVRNAGSTVSGNVTGVQASLSGTYGSTTAAGFYRALQGIIIGTGSDTPIWSSGSLVGNVNVHGDGTGATTSTGGAIGVYGVAGHANNADAIGVVGIGQNSVNVYGTVGLALTAGTSTVTATAGYFALSTTSFTEPTHVSAALIADNGATTDPIFLARDNGTNVFEIADGGNVGIGATPSGSYHLDIQRNVNSGHSVRVYNNDAGASAYGEYQLSDGTTSASFFLFGAGYTTSGLITANQAAISSQASGGLLFYSNNASAPVILAQGGTAAARERIRLSTTEIVLNDAAQNIDFRVEGQTITSLIHADASADRVGIGTSAPDSLLHVDRNQNGDTVARISNVSTGASARAHLYIHHASLGGYVMMLGSGYSGSGLASAGSFIVRTDAGATGLHLYTGGTEPLKLGNNQLERMSVNASDIVVNDLGSDVDFRVEGDTNANLLFVDAGTDRVGFGTNAPAYFADIRGALVAQMAVEARTTATSPAASDSRKAYTNEGATSQVAVTLPAAAAGLEYTFIVQDADGIQITAAAGDTIRQAGSVSSSGGTATSTTIGDTLTLLAINATEWIAIASHGTWTLA